MMRETEERLDTLELREALNAPQRQYWSGFFDAALHMNILAQTISLKTGGVETYFIPELEFSNRRWGLVDQLQRAVPGRISVQQPTPSGWPDCTRHRWRISKSETVYEFLSGDRAGMILQRPAAHQLYQLVEERRQRKEVYGKTLPTDVHAIRRQQGYLSMQAVRSLNRNSSDQYWLPPAAYMAGWTDVSGSIYLAMERENRWDTLRLIVNVTSPHRGMLDGVKDQFPRLSSVFVPSDAEKFRLAMVDTAATDYLRWIHPYQRYRWPLAEIGIAFADSQTVEMDPDKRVEANHAFFADMQRMREELQEIVISRVDN